MGNLNWDKAKPRKPIETGYQDSLSKRAAHADRNWRRSAPSEKDRQLALAPLGSDHRVARAKMALATATAAVIHTDGGCEPNPGRGGWGTTIEVAGLETVSLWGGIDDTTNNRMEMTAAIVALSVLPTGCGATIYSDSQYLVKGMTQWLAGWKRKGFRRGGTLIPNTDLWRTLDALSRGKAINWRWVRGHNGHAGNERVDRLASRGRREQSP